MAAPTVSIQEYAAGPSKQSPYNAAVYVDVAEDVGAGTWGRAWVEWTLSKSGDSSAWTARYGNGRTPAQSSVLGAWNAAWILDAGTWTVTCTVYNEDGESASSTLDITVVASTRTTVYVDGDHSAAADVPSAGDESFPYATLQYALNTAHSSTDNLEVIVASTHTETLSARIQMNNTNVWIHTDVEGSKAAITSSIDRTIDSNENGIQNILEDIILLPGATLTTEIAVRVKGEGFAMFDCEINLASTRIWGNGVMFWSQEDLSRIGKGLTLIGVQVQATAEYNILTQAVAPITLGPRHFFMRDCDFGYSTGESSVRTTNVCRGMVLYQCDIDAETADAAAKSTLRFNLGDYHSCRLTTHRGRDVTIGDLTPAYPSIEADGIIFDANLIILTGANSSSDTAIQQGDTAVDFMITNNVILQGINAPGITCEFGDRGLIAFNTIKLSAAATDKPALRSFNFGSSDDLTMYGNLLIKPSGSNSGGYMFDVSDGQPAQYNNGTPNSVTGQDFYARQDELTQLSEAQWLAESENVAETFVNVDIGADAAYTPDQYLECPSLTRVRYDRSGALRPATTAVGHLHGVEASAAGHGDKSNNRIPRNLSTVVAKLAEQGVFGLTS